MVYKSLIRTFDYFIRLLSFQLLHWNTDLPVLWHRFNLTLTTNEFYNILVSDGSATYIDKTGFVEEYLESAINGSNLLLITRPRKWGKTINLHMLKSFLEIELNSDTGDPIPKSDRINRKLFYGGVIRSNTSGQPKHLKPLKIARSDKTLLSLFQGIFPVLYIDLKCIAGDSYRQIEYNLKQYLMFLFDRYRYLNSWTDNDRDKLLFENCRRGTNRLSHLLQCLPLLTGLMNKRYRQKVYLLLDDYDAPQNRLLYRLASDDGKATVKLDSVLNSSSFTKATSLLSRLFARLFCGNEALYRSLMTGLFPIGTFQMRSDLRDILSTSTVLDLEYSDYFGFREPEVRQLLQQFSLSHKMDEVRAWYGGFNIGETEYFHPYCVVKYLEKTGAYYDRKINVVPGIDFLDYLLSSDNYQSEVRDLAIDGTVTVEKFDTRFTTFIEFARGNLYPYLICAGYLSPAFTVRADLKMDFRVPNEQAKEVYKERILDWRQRVFPLLISDEVRHYMLLLVQNKFSEFEQWLKAVFGSMEHLDKQKVSKTDPICIRVTEEMYYSCCVYFLALEVSDCHDVIAGQDSDPTKDDRTDIEIVPRKRTGYHNAVIFDFSAATSAFDVDSEAEKALQRIDRKKFAWKFRNGTLYDHVKNVTSVGVGFRGRKVSLKFRIRRLRS